MDFHVVYLSVQTIPIYNVHAFGERVKPEEKVERSIALLEEMRRRDEEKWIDKCRDLHISSADLE